MVTHPVTIVGDEELFLNFLSPYIVGDKHFITHLMDASGNVRVEN